MTDVSASYAVKLIFPHLPSVLTSSTRSLSITLAPPDFSPEVPTGSAPFYESRLSISYKLLCVDPNWCIGHDSDCSSACAPPADHCHGTSDAIRVCTSCRAAGLSTGALQSARDHPSAQSWMRRRLFGCLGSSHSCSRASE